MEFKNRASKRRWLQKIKLHGSSFDVDFAERFTCEVESRLRTGVCQPEAMNTALCSSDWSADTRKIMALLLVCGDWKYGEQLKEYVYQEIGAEQRPVVHRIIIRLELG